MGALRQTILDHLPDGGIVEAMSYGMIGYVVPHSVYPAGYHCDPKLPLPFISIASQKNHIGLYHMGLYTSPNLMEWFTTEFPSTASANSTWEKAAFDSKRPSMFRFRS